jgi:riboflavin synthase
VFTGIVETVGIVSSVSPGQGATRFAIEAPAVAAEVVLGDSVAVNGACLTVSGLEGPKLGFDAVRETLERTNLGGLAAGARVNLERALRAGDRLDGHIVQGHVDGLGRVVDLERVGDDVRFVVGCEADFADLLVEKGSVTIDGVSLTVVGVAPEGFDVVLIPHTLKETTLGERERGARLNLEADILGKYVKRYLEQMRR